MEIQNKIAEELGEKIIEEIGSGDFGTVFLLESGKVLKFTSDQNEVIIAKKLTKNKNLFKYILNYYNVGEVENKNIELVGEKYFILMDYVETLSKLQRESVNYVYKPLLQFSKSFYKSVFHPEFINLVLDKFSIVKLKNSYMYKIYTESQLKQMKEFAISLIPHIQNIAKELKLHGINQCDFHGGNLGWNEDHTRLIIFDITTPQKYGLDKLMIPDLKLKKYAVYEYHGSTPPQIIKNRIYQIAEKLGEEIIQFIGSGAYGYTYATKSGKILKITSDKKEANVAYKLAKNRNWMKYIVNFYNVGRVEITNKIDYLDSNIYEWYILMDYLNGLTEKEELAIDPYQGLIQYKSDFYKNITDKEAVMDHLNFYFDESDEANRIASNGYNPQEIKKLAINFYPMIVNIAKELKKHKIQSTDFHSQNIGWDANRKNLVLFDLGGNYNKETDWMSFINVKFKTLHTEKFITKFKKFKAFL